MIRQRENRVISVSNWKMTEVSLFESTGSGKSFENILFQLQKIKKSESVICGFGVIH